MNFPANWKTTASGLGAILIAAGSLVTHLSAGDTSTIATDGAIILTGLVGWFAQDGH